MKYRLIFIVLSLIFLIGCYEEDPLTSSEGVELKYTVPQGDHDYDAKIVDWYEKDGFYILYKFEPKDIYFNVSTWTGSIYDSLREKPGNGIMSVVAEEEYVGQQLQLVEEVFLNFYSDTVLRTWLPMKILLCSELTSNQKRIDMSVGFDNIAVNYGSQEIEGLLADDAKKIKFKNDLHTLFIERLIVQKKLVAVKEFEELSVYGKVVKQENMYPLGFIVGSANSIQTVESDLGNYIRAVFTYSYDELTAEPGDKDYTMKGILHPKKDVNGLIRKKYDILTGYFKDTLHMDLQVIGNYMK